MFNFELNDFKIDSKKDIDTISKLLYDFEKNIDPFFYYLRLNFFDNRYMLRFNGLIRWNNDPFYTVNNDMQLIKDTYDTLENSLDNFILSRQQSNNRYFLRKYNSVTERKLNIFNKSLNNFEIIKNIEVNETDRELFYSVMLGRSYFYIQSNYLTIYKSGQDNTLTINNPFNSFEYTIRDNSNCTDINVDKIIQLLKYKNKNRLLNLYKTHMTHSIESL